MALNPKTDTEEPMRATLLSDKELPRLVISQTDSENREPSRATPKSATVDPRRAKLLREMDEPTEQLS
jgi:hypothetical protein